MLQRMKIEVSTWTIVKFILVLIGFYVLFQIRDVIALLFIVLIMVATFSRTVDNWAKKITRPGAVVALLLCMLALFVAVVSLVLPLLVTQTIQLVQNFPEYLNRFSIIHDNIPQIKIYLTSLSSQLGGLSSSLITFTTGLFGGVVAVVTGLVMFTYLLLDQKDAKHGILSIFPADKRETAGELLRKVGDKAGSWLRGQLSLGLIMGVLNLIGLLVIGIPYALTLAVISAVFEIIPTIGPIISGLLAVTIAFTVSPVKAIIIVAWYLLMSQVENSFIVPKVMQRAVGLPPVMIIIAILAGAKIYGIVGVILAVPLTAIVLLLVQEWSTVKSLLQNEN